MPPPTHSVAQPVARLAALQLVEQRAQDDAAGGAQRVAHRDGAAVDVDAVRVDAQVARRLHRHHGEGLVDLPQVDVRAPPCRPWPAPCGRPASGPVSMMVGSLPITAAARMRARGFSPALRAALRRAHQHQRRAVDDARRVAGVVHVLDALHGGVLAQRGGVEAHAAHHREAGLELGHRLERWRSARIVSSSVQHRQAGDVVHRHDGAARSGLRRAPPRPAGASAARRHRRRRGASLPAWR